MAGATTFAFRAMDMAGARHRGRTRGGLQGPGQRAAAPARPDRPRRQRKVAAAEARGPPDPLEGRRHAGAGGLLAPVRDPRLLRDADDPDPPDARGADSGRHGSRRRSRGLRSDVEAGSTLEKAMERLPRSLRPIVPRDGPLRRAVGSPRGRARPGRVPGRESRQPAPPGEIGADVPGPDLRLRRRRPARRRRLHHSRLRRDLRRDRERKPGGRLLAADPDPDVRATPPTRSPATGS